MPRIEALFATSFVFNSIVTVGAFAAIVMRLRDGELGRPPGRLDVLVTASALFAAALGTAVIVAASWWLLVLSVVLPAGLLVLPRLRWWRLHLAGTLLILSAALSMIVGSVWAVHFVADLTVSTATRTLLWVLCGMGILALPSSGSSGFLEMQVLLRDDWTRPNLAVAPRTTGGRKVSIHVPCHAEPAQMVTATLDALSRLDYDDFEVIVVDNNTRDPQLWEPVAAHCAFLGERFRFYHHFEIVVVEPG